MNSTILQSNGLLVSGEGTLRRITLNRPQAMNALTLDMILTMDRMLRSWESDPQVGVVLLYGTGDRGLSAGGDIRALYDAVLSGSDLPGRFWRDEYRLDALIARFAGIYS
jgi:enoyl-CoA hydratase